MRDSKKALLATGAFVLLFALLSGAFLMFSTPFTHNYDWHLREQLAGKLDFLIVGASHGQCALNSRELDALTGCNSYNLCYDAEGNYEKQYLLREELTRNQIKTVVLELSYDTMQAAGTTGFTDSNVFTVMRMNSLADRMAYWLGHVKLDNKLYVYAEMMYLGFFEWRHPQIPFDAEQAALKGGKMLPGQDQSLPDEALAATHHENWFTLASFREETVNGFTDLIQLCQAHGARVIVAVVPVSDQCLWRAENLDAFTEWENAYCAEQNVEFYDFNLLRERFALLSDEDCYSTDPMHMSEKGARIFTEAFARIIQAAADGQDVSSSFYQSYSEMQWDSPYMARFQAE